MPRMVSLPAVARAAGVSVSTASRALNDDPQVSAETRKRVIESAKKLGYHKNAEITALMRNFRTGGNESVHRGLTLAFLASQPQSFWSAPEFDFCTRIFSGARARADNLGYKLDVFWIHQPGYSLARLGSILRARGIRGVILSPLPKLMTLPDFPWENFSSVAIGRMLKEPRLHRVEVDTYGNMSIILAQFAARDYQRIGFVTQEVVETRLGCLAAARFAIYQQGIPPRRRIPVLNARSLDDQALDTWLKKYQPDAVVSQINVCDRILRFEKSDGGNVAFAWLATQPNTPTVPGTELRQESLGEAACDLLASLVAHGDKGVPTEPRSLVIPGAWREGLRA